MARAKELDALEDYVSTTAVRLAGVWIGLQKRARGTDCESATT